MIEAETGRPLLAPQTLIGEIEQTTGSTREMFQKPYLNCTIMLIIFQLVQTIGYYGFSSWVPTLLAWHGVDLTKSLAYTSIIAVAWPVAALVATQIAGPPVFAAEDSRRPASIRPPHRVLEHHPRQFVTCLSV